MSVKGKWARLFVDEFDLSTKTSTATINMSVGREETTPWQATAREYIAAEGESSIEITGYVDALTDGLGGLEEVMAARLGGANTTQVGVLLAEAATGEAGMPVYVLPATSGERMNISSPASGILTLDGSFPAGDVGMRRGRLVYRGTVNATGALPGVDFGATGSAGGQAFLFLQAIGGTATNATINVQSATVSNFSDNINLGAFTVSAVGGYRITLIAANGKYVRAFVTGMGGATSLTFALVVALNGITQP